MAEDTSENQEWLAKLRCALGIKTSIFRCLKFALPKRHREHKCKEATGNPSVSNQSRKSS
eukprot:4988134-Amphidinium_carterae.1